MLRDEIKQIEEIASKIAAEKIAEVEARLSKEIDDLKKHLLKEKKKEEKEEGTKKETADSKKHHEKAVLK